MAIKFIFDSPLTIFVVTLNKEGSYNRKEELHSSAILLIFQFVPNAAEIRQQMLEIHHSADLSLFFRWNQVVFLYPDMRTGLKGKWSGKQVLNPKVVELVAERCRWGNTNPIRIDTHSCCPIPNLYL